MHITVKKLKGILVTLVCMVLLCAIVTGCTAAGSTGGQQNLENDPSTTQPSTPPVTSPSTTVGTEPADPQPTEPEEPNGILITVEKEDNVYDSVNETMKLVFDDNGNLVEYWVGIRKLVYTYDDRGNMLSKSIYYQSGELNSQTNYTYDEAGRLVKTEGFGYAEVYTTYMSEFFYDDAGNLIREKAYENGELWKEEVYDANGNILEGFSYMGGGYDFHSVYTYDEAGKLQSIRTDRSGEPRSGGDYFYDEAGRLIREEIFQISNGERKELVNTYTYDENGRCIRYDIGGYQGEQSYETYTYDDAGRMLSSEYHHYQESGNAGNYWTYDEAGRITSWTSTNRQGTTVYTWEYDEQGNACKHTQDTAGTDFVYSFHYTWPEETLPQEAWDMIRLLMDQFSLVSVYTPEVYARIYD